MMLSVSQITTTLQHWLESSQIQLEFEIDSQCLSLIKKGQVIELRLALPATVQQIPDPTLFLQLSEVGIDQFNGVPAINEQHQYCIIDWCQLTDSATAALAPLVTQIEALINQQQCWASMLNHQVPKPHSRPSPQVVPLSLSQQMRQFSSS
ncbi:hypothetical protein F9817_14305 [Vibrio sp. CAIM 722]|uniref:Type III secretion protein n=1 Tax=Vibrio eleionomae TaxID=2653505 RepID=A0A7X4LMR5_9VIBR|nr:hypothetical protein [Vibrio eleionomae]MZI94366.1 hypothetical protein [Vibrio eleionomae]